ncbi:MAG: glycoside hydrolase family 15 protein [Proteobacteria bacterium]|nr:glycoside hydrolase family 15 protein [Pseudomonadota bacterium]
MSQRPKVRRIEDYALIGDCETAALVGRDGSVDWLCWPRFDSPACFAALLGSPENGRWRIAPKDDGYHVTRRYLGCSLVLETVFSGPDGEVAVIDFMPPYHDETGIDLSDLVRIVEGRRGTVAMCVDLTLRFDYGASIPWVEKLKDEPGLSAVAGPDRVILRTPVPLHGKEKCTTAEFTIEAGSRIPFVLTHQPSHLPLAENIDAEKSLTQTLSGWKDWSARCNYQGPWREAVMRSLLTLKALTYRPTGGIVAAPTTSLPERIGGPRNWDYRYCWIRDATLTLLSLMHTGYYDEAEAWRHWLVRAAAGAPAQMQMMYGIAGERRLAEWEVPWLPGYEGSRPVRVGNAAATQLQIDVYGELMDALYQAREGGLAFDKTAWGLQRAVTDHLERVWPESDEGIWEVRGGRQHFTFSRVMAWVAFDRAVSSVEKGHGTGPLQHWREIRAKIHTEICARGFDAQQNSFVQVYDGKALDASLLLLPLVGFLPADDPRIIGTLAAIREKLVVDGFVLRYDTDETRDGVPGDEGVFLACSFWLVDNLILQGKQDEATELFDRLLSLRNDLGLLSEEYDPHNRCQVGNFPQAFSHVALINSALNLTRAQNPATQRAQDGHGATATAPSPVETFLVKTSSGKKPPVESLSARNPDRAADPGSR